MVDCFYISLFLYLHGTLHVCSLPAESPLMSVLGIIMMTTKVRLKEGEKWDPAGRVSEAYCDSVFSKRHKNKKNQNFNLHRNVIYLYMFLIHVM